MITGYPQPDAAPTAPAPDDLAALPPASRRFRLRTVLLPVIFMLLHVLVINIAAMVYLLIIMLIRQTLGGSSLGGPLDADALNQAILQEYPRIAVFQSLILIPVYAIYLFIQRRDDARTVWLYRVKTVDVLPAVAIMIGALGLTNLLFNLLQWLSQSQPLIKELVDDYIAQSRAYTSDSGFFWLILGISVLAPISEELLFRGIVQGELRKAMPEWLAVIIQAVLFALFHMQPIQILYVIAPALLLGAAYAWTRSLWVPIIMHITFNFMGSALPAWIGEDNFLSSVIGYVEIAFIAVGTLAAIFLAVRSRQRFNSPSVSRTAEE